MAQFSFVVPVYKVDYGFLRNCIENLQKQTYQDIEIVLVDDGSPDDCGKICDGYAAQDERIKVVHKPNGGLSDARNAGTAAVTTPWVTYVDGDDWVDADFAEIFLERMQKQETVADVYIYTGYRNYIDMEKAGTPIFADGTRFVEYHEREALQTECCIGFTKDVNDGLFIGSACGKVYSVSFLRGKDVKFKIVPYGEDSIFYLDFTENAQCIEYVAHPIYHYRDTAGSMVNGYRKNADREQIIYLNEIFSFAERYQKSKEFIDILYFRVFASMQRVISQKYANKNNPDKYRKRYRECNTYFHTAPYKEWYKHIRFSSLSKNNKLKYLLLRMKLYFAMDSARNLYMRRKGYVQMKVGDNDGK